MPGRLRPSSLFLAGAVASAGTALLAALAACSSFVVVPADADADGGDGGGGNDAARVVDGDLDAGRDAGEGDAGCAQLGPDFLEEGWRRDTPTVQGNFILHLTQALASQRGLTWHALDLAPTRSFRATFTLTVTTASPYAIPADGVAFFWSGDAVPVAGAAGNDLGFCSTITPGGVSGTAVALFTSPIPVDGGPSRSSVHVKDNVKGKCVDDGPEGPTPALASPDAGVDLMSEFEVLLDGPSAMITVRRDGKDVIRQSLDLLPTQIRSIGFTASTGDNFAAHTITKFNFTTCP